VRSFPTQPRVLDLDIGSQPPRMRVEDDDRPHLLLLRDVDLPRE
jgi:hypothetical protein